MILEPSLTLEVPQGYYAYDWEHENGTLISTSSIATIEMEGNYILTITDFANNILCSNTYTFRLIRSKVPKIQNVEYGDLGDNFVKIVAVGDGDFEYSIDGITFQDSNYFGDIMGGTYDISVRDKGGCGEDNTKVTVMDYPKFFTPNMDGVNDYWQISGIDQYPNSNIEIYDRYGKLIHQFSEISEGWDGTYNGRPMPSSDYWFKVVFVNKPPFTGHFSLKR